MINLVALNNCTCCCTCSSSHTERLAGNYSVLWFKKIKIMNLQTGLFQRPVFFCQQKGNIKCGVYQNSNIITLKTHWVGGESLIVKNKTHGFGIYLYPYWSYAGCYGQSDCIQLKGSPTLSSFQQSCLLVTTNKCN